MLDPRATFLLPLESGVARFALSFFLFCNITQTTYVHHLTHSHSRRPLISRVGYLASLPFPIGVPPHHILGVGFKGAED